MARFVRFKQRGKAFYARQDDGRLYPLSRAPWLGGTEQGKSLPESRVQLLAPCEPRTIFAVGLNLSGVFEVGSVTVGDSLAQRSGPFGAFFTGVLAVAVAAPCTAPFMAAALGFALTQSVTSAMLIFLGLGVGFAVARHR